MAVELQIPISTNEMAADGGGLRLDFGVPCDQPYPFP